jgi:3-phenylpropionate/trans-cinnamate dioxygenase ferredoxin reductase component
MRPDHIAIVGASLAGVRTAEALRRLGFLGALTIVGDEPHVPYDRPPLSKGYLAGTRRLDQLPLHPPAPMLEDLDVEVVTGIAATGVDLAARILTTSDGHTIEFDALVAATGTRLRHLPPETMATTGPPVLGLRTLSDADRLKPFLTTGANVVVVGAGFIGAEVASTASQAGCNASVVEALPIPLQRQLGAEMGALCGRLHQRQDVRLLTNTTLAQVDKTGVVLSTGEHLAADVIVVGIGVLPNVEWLEDTGLDLSNGVLCDSTLRAHTDMVAVGDVARWPNTRYNETARIEHWTNAVESAEHAAATLLGGNDPFEPVPYFWSDQYGAKIQCIGRTTGYDEVRVVAGSTDDLKFLALYRKGDALVAALGVSMVRQVMGFRQLLLDRVSWTNALDAVP